MATISLRGIVKRYSKTQVIHGIDCEIADGEFIVIVGPSGCGKTTLLRMIAGLETISEGEIAIGDQVVNQLEPAQRDIAMVFQNYALYPHMTVYRNMAYGLKIRGMNAADIDARVRRAAGILDLPEELLQRTPRQLSGGQRQRVAMGRAIVREPRTFLFDEPLSNLDAKLRVQMRLEIKKLHAELGTTSVYVTHDQVEAMTLGHRLIVMNHGQVEQIGDPLTVYQQPASEFVAGFIGSPPMNFLDAGLRAGELYLAGGERPLPVALRPDPADGPVRVGLRPEHLRLCPVEQSWLQLEVGQVELQGAETLIHGRVLAQPLILRLGGIHRPARGEVLGLRFDPEDLHLFEPDGGRRRTEWASERPGPRAIQGAGPTA